MMNLNNENTLIGLIFQQKTIEVMRKRFREPFSQEVKIPIGNPPKEHRFDCVSKSGSIVVECKYYTWTDTGNIPSAKMATLNEAVFYMSYLPNNILKIIAMKKATYPGKIETLAEYYSRVNDHLLHDIEICEIDDSGNYKVIRSGSSTPKIDIRVHPKIIDEPHMSINNLWWAGTEEQWNCALDHYWKLLRPENVPIERKFENIDTASILTLDVYDFYRFLYEEYYVWKYTAKNRLATTRKNLEKYISENRLFELAGVQYQLLQLDRRDALRGIEIAMSIRGLGTAGATGLLSILFPQYFATVDQFVVKALLDINNLPQHDKLQSIRNPEALLPKDGVLLETIIKDKAAELNIKFKSREWTPRKIDKVLWSICR